MYKNITKIREPQNAVKFEKQLAEEYIFHFKNFNDLR